MVYTNMKYSCKIKISLYSSTISINRLKFTKKVYKARIVKEIRRSKANMI